MSDIATIPKGRLAVVYPNLLLMVIAAGVLGTAVFSYLNYRERAQLAARAEQEVAALQRERDAEAQRWASRKSMGHVEPPDFKKWWAAQSPFKEDASKPAPKAEGQK